MESIWILSGVHQESIRSLPGVHTLYQESIRSRPGVHQEYQDFIRTPDGVHQDAWGSVTYSNVSTPFMLFMVKGTSSLLDIIERSVTFNLQDLVSSQMRLILHFGLVFLVSVEQLEMAINLLHKE